MPVPDFADPRPPYVQIAADLRAKIADGKYAPGDRLPAITELAAEYHSASETIRRALGVLRDEGLVESHSTRGTFVLKAPEPAAPAASAERVAELEQRVEAQAADVDAIRADLGRQEAQILDLYRKLGEPRRGHGRTAAG